MLVGWSLEPGCVNHSKNPDICVYLIVTGENRRAHKEVVASSVMYHTACSLLNLKITQKKSVGFNDRHTSTASHKTVLVQGAANRDCVLVFLLGVALCRMSNGDALWIGVLEVCKLRKNVIANTFILVLTEN